MACEKVFISHSSLNRPFVEEDILPQVEGAKRKYWFAPDDIGGGDDWRQELRHGMDACQRLLVVVSKDAIASKEVKIEVADSTSKLLATNARLDARRIHRKILPVVMDERNEFGEQPGGDEPDEPLPPMEWCDKCNSLHEPAPDTKKLPEASLIHPYLTMVNFIPFPHNAELNKKLDPESDGYVKDKSGKYVDPENRLSKDQLKSVNQYAKDRDTARKNLKTALRNPDALQFGFKPIGRLLALLVNPTFQRVALAMVLLAAMVPVVVVAQQIQNFLSGAGATPGRPAGDTIVNGTSSNTGPAGANANQATPINNGLPKDAGPPEIRILIEPVGADVGDAASDEESVSFPRKSDGMTYVSLQSDTDPGENSVKSDSANPKHTQKVVVRIRETPNVRVREISESEVEAKELVLRVRATVDGGTPPPPKYVELMPTKAPSAPPEIEIAKVGENDIAVELTEQISEISVTEETHLRIGIKGEEPRIVKLMPPASPKIEIIEGDEVVKSFAVPDWPPEISVSSDPITTLRWSGADEPSGAKSVRLVPTEPTSDRLTENTPADPEIEITQIQRIGGKWKSQPIGKPTAAKSIDDALPISVQEDPSFLRIQPVGWHGKSWLVKLRARKSPPVTDDDPPEVEPTSPELEIEKVREDGTVVQAYAPGQMPDIYVTEETRLRIGIKGKKGPERFVRLMQPASDTIEIIEGDEVVKAFAVPDWPPEISVSRDPVTILRWSGADELSGEKSVRLVPTEPPSERLTENALAEALEVEIVIKNNGAVVTDDVELEAGKPTELVVESRPKNAKTPILESRRVMLLPPDDGPAEIKIRPVKRVADRTVYGRALRMEVGKRPNVTVTKDPTLLGIQANTKNAEGQWMYVRLQPDAIPLPHPSVSVPTSGGPTEIPQPAAEENYLVKLLTEGWGKKEQHLTAAQKNYQLALQTDASYCGVDYAMSLVDLRANRQRDAKQHVSQAISKSHDGIEWDRAVEASVWLDMYSNNCGAAMRTIRQICQETYSDRSPNRASEETCYVMGISVGMLKGPWKEKFRSLDVDHYEEDILASLQSTHRESFERGRDETLDRFRDLRDQLADAEANEAAAAEERRRRDEEHRKARMAEIEKEANQIKAELEHEKQQAEGLCRQNEVEARPIQTELNRVRLRMGELERAYRQAEAELRRAQSMDNPAIGPFSSNHEPRAAIVNYVNYEKDGDRYEPEGPGRWVLAQIIEQDTNSEEIRRLQLKCLQLQREYKRHEQDGAVLQRSYEALDSECTRALNRYRSIEQTASRQLNNLTKEYDRLQAVDRRAARSGKKKSAQVKRMETLVSKFTTYRQYPIEERRSELLNHVQGGAQTRLGDDDAVELFDPSRSR